MPEGDYIFIQTKTVAPAITIGAMRNNNRAVTFQDQEAMNRNAELVKNISGTMRLKTMKKEVGKGVYGDRFKDVLSESERKKQIKSSDSELGIKAENKKLLLGAKAEYRKHIKGLKDKLLKKKEMKVLEERRPAQFDDLTHLLRLKDTKFDESVITGYMSEVDQERFDAMDLLVGEFVNQDFSFDFSTDQAFARESMRLERMNQRAESFKNILVKNTDYWYALAEESRVAIMEKFSQASQIWSFYKARRDLLCDDFYSTHLDKEMSYYNDKGTTSAQAKVFIFMQRAEEAYERLRNHGEDNADERIMAALDQKFIDENVYSRVVGHKGEKTKSKSQGFQWMDLFGTPLNFLSWLMRDKRKKTHGYDKGKDRELDAKYAKYPQSLKYIGRGGRPLILLTRTNVGNELFAPNIELTSLFKDPLKLEILEKLDANEALGAVNDYQLEESKKKRENTSKTLFVEFADAAKKYCSIGGIVNADTTELEMAYLDKMRYYAEDINKNFGGKDDLTDRMRDRLKLVNQIMGKIKTERSGNLAKEADSVEYESAIRTTNAVIQDTTFTENMDESNIKDIPLFTHYPNINDIKQGTIGDCYLVAAMTSLVKTSPEAVMNMFQDLGDGDVMVRLYEGYDKEGNRLDTDAKWAGVNRDTVEMKPVYIKVRKHYETGDGNANDCVWPQLLEKAYAASGFNMKGEAYVDEMGYLHNMEKELTAGEGYIALSHLTGSYQKYERMMVTSTEQEDQAEREEYFKFFNKENCRDRLSAGIPRFFVDYMMDHLNRTEIASLDQQKFFNRFEQDMGDVCRIFGSQLLQIKKNFVRNGMTDKDYVPVIKRIAESMGMKLAEDWDTKSSDTKDTIFDTKTNGRVWDGMFDMDFLKQFATKFRENFESMRTEGTRIYDHTKALDLPEFSYDRVSKLLEDLSNIGIKGTGELAGKPDQEIFNKTIDDALNFGGDEVKREKRKREHANHRRETWNKSDNRESASRYFKRVGLYGHERCKASTISFLADLQEALAAGGSIEVSINHFVSAVGMQWLNGEYYVLVKDPFNVYNRQYGRRGNQMDYNEDGFLDVFSIDGYKVKRHLSDNEYESAYGAFRGLSYWKANDLCDKMEQYIVIKPQDIRKNKKTRL